MAWQNDLPLALRKKLQTTLQRRDVGPADIWADVQEWLIQSNIPAPDRPFPATEEQEMKYGDIR
ncbi:MAG: hypothetical protein AAF066_11230 [Pseudomonadota bacterium]